MKYCILTTQSHPRVSTNLSCLIDINELIIKEGYDDEIVAFINNEVVIDVDKLEREVAILEDRSVNKSMDMAFAIKDKTEENREIVLVELKLNYVNNLRNLDIGAILDKPHYTSQLLSSNLPIHNRYVFIFKFDLMEQAKSRLRNLPKSPNSFIPMDMNDLKNTFFD